MKFKETLLDCGEIRPRRRNLFACLQRETNLKCLILTLLLSGCLVATVVWCTRTTRVTTVDFSSFPIATTRQVSPCDEGFAYIPAAFIITLYFVYLVECYHSKAHELLSLPKIDVNTVYRKVHQLRRAKPLVWWKAVCYHYVDVRRYRSGDVGAFTTSKVCYERVNTHTATSFFSFFMCGMKDISRDLVDLEKHAVTKVRFKKGFIFSNTATATEFQDQRAIFFQEQEQWDDYMEMKEGLDLANISFAEQVTSWANADDLPWFGQTRVFWLCSLFLLSWPLRIILELNTAHVHYQVTKLFGTNYVSPQDNYMMTTTGNTSRNNNNNSLFPESHYARSITATIANDIQPHQWWRRAIWLSHLVHPFKHFQRRGGGTQLLLENQQQQQSLDTLESSSTSSMTEERQDENHGGNNYNGDTSTTDLQHLLVNIEDAHLDFSMPLLPNRRKKFNGMWSHHHVHLDDTINESEEDFMSSSHSTKNSWAMWQHDGGVRISGRRHSDSFTEQGWGRGLEENSNNNQSNSNLVPTYSQALLLLNGENTLNRHGGMTPVCQQQQQLQDEHGHNRGIERPNPQLIRIASEGNEPRQTYNNGDNYGLSNTLLTGARTVVVPPCSFHHHQDQSQPQSQSQNDSRNHDNNVENGRILMSPPPPPSLRPLHDDDDEPFLQGECLGPQSTTNSSNEPRERPCRRTRRIPMPTSNSLSTFISHSSNIPQSTVLLRSFSVSNFQSIPTPSRSDSFRALCAAMPRTTGVEIDLTHPVSASVPPDPLLGNSNSNSAQLMMVITRPTSLLSGQGQSQSQSQVTTQHQHHHQHQLQPEIESPPNYIEALRTSRPVFLPPWTRLRRCFTEKNLNSFSSTSASSSNPPHYKCRRPVWLQETSSTFLVGNNGNRRQNFINFNTNASKSSSTFPVPL